MDELKLSELIIDDTKIWELPYISVYDDHIRIFYKKGEIHGFQFWAVNLTSSPSYEQKWVETNKNHVEIMIHGLCYFDGIRHLYFGHELSDNEGYFYYPQWDQIEATIVEIKKLEQKFKD